MDIGDVFRRFFGFPNRIPPNWQNRHPSEEGDEYDDDGEGLRFGGSGGLNDDDTGAGHPSFEFFFGIPNGKEGLDDMFEHFHGDMWRQMESLHRQMEDMMKGFGTIDFPTEPDRPSQPSIGDSDQSDEKPKNKGNPFVWFHTPSPFFGRGPNPNQSPRDFMLKDGKGEEDQPTVPAHPEPRRRTIFSLPSWRKPEPEKKQDTDLDGKLSEEQILSLVQKPQSELRRVEQPPQQRRPHFFSSGSSVTFTTVQGADGKVEQKKVVRDSSGHEETTVTRSLGNQSHTVKTVTEGDGRQEKHETFQNMDEKDMGQFEEQWSQPSQRPTSPADSLIAPTPVPRIDSRDQDLFSQFFGWRDK
ncbi:HCLS1-associated protein X-1 [Aplysia californica]|uniref:HCLS1-associated protein X-1 n=1 Tax=Aplysia californica TaxID=6500 RepID=A0ABM0JA51_APLCA|nr:HCLS1-associated protein X-1 [Aplysia californica]